MNSETWGVMVDSAEIMADLRDKMAAFEEVTPLPKIIESLAMTEPKLIRMCHSKKKRIVKKWLCNPRNYRRVPRRDILMVGEIAICHPSVAARFRKEVIAMPGTADPDPNYRRMQ